MFPHLGDGTVKNDIIWYIFEGRLYNFFESNLYKYQTSTDNGVCKL